MRNLPFIHHRAAALALLASRANLSRREAGFLGHVCVAELLSDNQEAWLAKLLARDNLPPLAERAAQ